MTDKTDLTAVGRYVDFWNATADADFAEQVRYHAPIGVLHGVGELIDFRGQFAEHQPGYVVRHRDRLPRTRRARPDRHGRRVPPQGPGRLPSRRY
ncbi:hypothetical protein ACWGID_08695 [Kribbella sp. NPDC054772]